MKCINKLLFILPFVLLIQCNSKSTIKPEEPSVVSIRDVWFSDGVDNDGDGYFSYAHFNFDIDVNKGSMEIFIKLGVRVTSPSDTATYYIYFESVDFPVEGSTTDDAQYISIGDPNDELPQGRYDFLLQVFSSSDPNIVIAEASPATDNDLYRVSFESANKDQAIYTTWLSYHDGTFEGIASTSGALTARGYIYGCLAVKFDRPANAVSCAIKKVKIHVDNSPSNIYLIVWSNNNDKPYQHIYFSDNTYYLNTGWNEITMNVDVVSYDTFYVGYGQTDQLSPYLSIDKNSSISQRSYEWDYHPATPPATGGSFRWTVNSYSNFAIDIYVEYMILGSTKAFGKWLTRSIERRQGIGDKTFINSVYRE